MNLPEHAIAEILTHPLVQRVEQATQASWGRYEAEQANTAVLECACAPRRFEDGPADIPPGSWRARDGMLAVPDGPGLGIEIDGDALAALRA